MNGYIYIGIASYRDKDLLKTVKSAYINAVHKDKLYFSIFSQESPEEHVDLSFIPDNQINHMVVPYQEAKGPCYARHVANYHVSESFDYFLQIDSHSRFSYGWDEILINTYNQLKDHKWGERFILSASASSFEFEWDEDGKDYKDVNFETCVTTNTPIWDEGERMFMFKNTEYTGDELGQEVFYIAAGFLFTSGKMMAELPYDPHLYFWGEEMTLAVRAYCKGIKIVAPPLSVVFSNFNRENLRHPLHWEDNPEKWAILDKSSKLRASYVLLGGRGFGEYGVNSLALHEEYQERSGIDLVNQNYDIEP